VASFTAVCLSLTFCCASSWAFFQRLSHVLVVFSELALKEIDLFRVTPPTGGFAMAGNSIQKTNAKVMNPILEKHGLRLLMTLERCNSYTSGISYKI